MASSNPGAVQFSAGSDIQGATLDDGFVPEPLDRVFAIAHERRALGSHLEPSRGRFVRRLMHAQSLSGNWSAGENHRNFCNICNFTCEQVATNLVACWVEDIMVLKLLAGHH